MFLEGLLLGDGAYLLLGRLDFVWSVKLYNPFLVLQCSIFHGDFGNENIYHKVILKSSL